MENENKEPEEKQEVTDEQQAENRPENEQADKKSPSGNADGDKNDAAADAQTKKSFVVWPICSVSCSFCRS